MIWGLSVVFPSPLFILQLLVSIQKAQSLQFTSWLCCRVAKSPALTSVTGLDHEVQSLQVIWSPYIIERTCWHQRICCVCVVLVALVCRIQSFATSNLAWCLCHPLEDLKWVVAEAMSMPPKAPSGWRRRSCQRAKAGQELSQPKLKPTKKTEPLLKISAVVLLAAGVTWGALTENPAEENFKEWPAQGMSLCHISHILRRGQVVNLLSIWWAQLTGNRVTSGDLPKHLAGDVPMEASERGTGRRGWRGCHWLQSGEGCPSGGGKWSGRCIVSCICNSRDASACTGWEPHLTLW